MKKLLFLGLAFFFLFSCDNDDNGNAPNENACTFEGATIEDQNNNTQTVIPESQLQTDFFPNNFGIGIPGVEIFDTSVPGDTFIVTSAVTLGDIDSTPEIRINNVDYTGTVTCQREGSAIGEELRLDVVVDSFGELELCVTIDNVTP